MPSAGGVSIVMLAVLVVGLVLATGAARLGGALVGRARAESAADAAALAAADRLALGDGSAARPAPRRPSPPRATTPDSCRATARERRRRSWSRSTSPPGVRVFGPARGRAKAEVRPECVVELPAVERYFGDRHRERLGILAGGTPASNERAYASSSDEVAGMLGRGRSAPGCRRAAGRLPSDAWRLDTNATSGSSPAVHDVPRARVGRKRDHELVAVRHLDRVALVVHGRRTGRRCVVTPRHQPPSSPGARRRARRAPRVRSTSGASCAGNLGLCRVRFGGCCRAEHLEHGDRGLLVEVLVPVAALR